MLELKDFFQHRLWQDEARGAEALFGLKCLRVLTLAGRGLIHNQALVRASSLAYATILGFIPLFALLFAILQAMGLPRLLATYTLEHLAPGSRQFATQILQYIESTKVTSLGVFGVVALLLDLVIIMTNVEKAFNKTWQVDRTRSWSRKVSDYLSIFLIFPIIMAVGLTFTTSFWGLKHAVGILTAFLPSVFFTATRWLVSLGLLWFAFTFIYLVMPNTRVNFWSAVLGGIVGGTVWQVAQYIFTAIQGGSAYYNAIYGTLYNLLFLFIWLFWCWLILLFGTEIAFAHQNLDYLTRRFQSTAASSEPVDEY
ncbi:MAG TPA: YihY/virulence factor BrkB family protein, partial [Desulfobaccales bacterium]|nr:YihY/virulence factor BrkB family protein [Desulfobaccales bacterium]